MANTPWRCQKCGHPLTHDQIDRAVLDAGYFFEDGWEAHMEFYCSSYDEEKGCQENDPDDAACWTDTENGDN